MSQIMWRQKIIKYLECQQLSISHKVLYHIPSKVYLSIQQSPYLSIYPSIHFFIGPSFLCDDNISHFVIYLISRFEEFYWEESQNPYHRLSLLLSSHIFQNKHQFKLSIEEYQHASDIDCLNIFVF